MESYTEQMKVPPHDLDLEANVLGILIAFGNETKVTARETLSEDDFYKTAHGHIFTASLEARDITHLTHLLEKAGLLEKVGGKDYIAKIAETAGIPAALPALMEILKELSQRRRLIFSTMKILEEAHNLNTNINEITLETIKTLRDSCQDGRGIVENPELAQVVFKDIEKRAQEGTRDVGLLSGLEILDSHLYGFENKTLTYVIGRPSMGKTALMLNIAGHMADHYPGKVLFYSLEMSKEALFRRRLAARSGIYLSRLRNADIGNPQWPDLVKASEELSESDLLIIDNTKYRYIEDLVANAHALAGEHKVIALFADHIQKMRSKQRTNNRHLEISSVSNEFANLAKDLEIPVIVASQLNRLIEARSDKRPMLSDMKESGDLEQDADLVLAIYRKDLNSEIMDIGCLKGRDIETFKGQLFFNGALQKCEDIGDEWSGQGIKSKSRQGVRNNDRDEKQDH